MMGSVFCESEVDIYVYIYKNETYLLLKPLTLCCPSSRTIKFTSNIQKHIYHKRKINLISDDDDLQKNNRK